MDATRLAQAFVDLTDTLVDDFDVHELLHVLATSCTELLGVGAAGLLLADERGRLRVAVASSEHAELLELIQLQNDEGPCLDCFRTGHAVVAGDLAASHARWPRFSAAAGEAGFVSVLALPMRMRGDVIGGLNLFSVDGVIEAEDPRVSVAQAMADVATIAITQDRLSRHREVLAEQLQFAVDSRVVIEQAKGVLAARYGVDMDDAFQMLRKRARDGRRRLVGVAQEVVGDTGAVAADVEVGAALDGKGPRGRDA
jgi:GAF domain-containing protein